ncbi:MAG: DUF2384 domain-containing protein [Chloroflexota bacterium]|nr:MAG: DUF2384 domain-containing protein [Chloroflexota bacterium]
MTPNVLLEMAPHQAIEQILSEFGLTPDDLARALKANPRSVERWRVGGTYPQHGARNRLAELVALHHHIRETFSSPEAARTWIHTANRYLGGMTPADAMRVGRFDVVESALEALDSGVFL